MLTVGIIGTGLIAKEHATAIGLLNGKLSLVAAADVAPARLHEFASEYPQIKTYADPSALIHDPAVQLVAITTPPAAHEELAIAALKAGKYVLCEKPLAHTLASAQRIADVAAQFPGKLSVSHQLRYDPQFQQLVWLCKNQQLGELQSALIERHGMIPHAVHGKSGWWGAWSVAGGGVLMTQLIHQVDLLLSVMGMPKSVNAQMDTRFTEIESEDWIEVDMQYDNGVAARCCASVNSGRQDGCFEIVGEHASAELPLNVKSSDNTRRRAILTALYSALPDSRPTSTSLPAKVVRKMRSKVARPMPALTAHALLYEDIERSVSTGKPLPIGPVEAMKSLELCLAAYQSAVSGQSVKLPLSSASEAYQGITKEFYDSRPKQSPKSRQPTTLAPLPTQIKSSVVPKEVRIGLIGLDTTHATAFTSILNDPFSPSHIPGSRVVAAYAGGSPDMPISISRVSGFTTEVRDKYAVEIKRSPLDVADASDLVFILASDGRVHVPLLRSIADAGKPVFMDKPLAISTADAESIFRIADEAKLRIFASSGFRYAKGLVDLLNKIHASGETIHSCTVRFWLQIQPTQGRYFWYGIHASEMLLAIMGPGLKQVTAYSEGDLDHIAVEHLDGRRSSIIGARNDGTFSVEVQTDSGKHFVDLAASMAGLSLNTLWAALDNLTEGEYPKLWKATDVGSVSGARPGRHLDPSREQTLDVIRLLDAAQRSHELKALQSV